MKVSTLVRVSVSLKDERCTLVRLEYQDSLTFVEGDALDTPDFMMVGLILGFPMGEELESLDRIEDKLDALK